MKTLIIVLDIPIEAGQNHIIAAAGVATAEVTEAEEGASFRMIKWFCWYLSDARTRIQARRSLPLYIGVIALVGYPSIAEPRKPSRTLPPIDAEVLTGPEMVTWKAERAQKEHIGAELRNETVRIEGDLEKAKKKGQSTLQLEAELKLVEERRDALYKPAPWDPRSMALPVFVSKVDEIKQIMGDGKSISVEDAQRLVDMLYTDIEPKFNCSLQWSTLRHIRQCADGNRITSDVRRFLRDSVLDYYNASRELCDEKNKGPMCSPQSMAFLGEAIAAATTSEDAEAVEALNHLKESALAKCDILQWENMKGMFVYRFETAQDALSLKEEDLRVVTDITEVALSDEDFGRLLRSYRKVLRGPPSRVKPEVVAIIDRNLLRLAQQKLSRKNWELWADAMVALSPQRASASLREYVSTQQPRKDITESKEMSRVCQMYSRFDRTP